MKIPTLNEAKYLYFQQLTHIVGDATTDELNELSNRIHRGVSQYGCGTWQKDKLAFTHCEDENCQMLSESLTLWAIMPVEPEDKDSTLPQGRPEFITLIFDGNSQHHQRLQIANTYFERISKLSLNPDEIDAIHDGYAKLLDQKLHWASIDELSALIEQFK